MLAFIDAVRFDTVPPEPIAMPRNAATKSFCARLRPSALAIALTTLLSGLSGCREDSSGAAGPNVILISLDSCRPDHLSAYGYSRPTSPRLDELAARGTLFENCFSSTSWTLPAHMALFTSLPDTAHGVYDNGQPPLDPYRVVLAQQFKARGYATAGFVSGPYLHPAFGFDRGFDEYFNCTSYLDAKDFTDSRFREFKADAHRESHRDVTNPRLFEKVHQWLDARGPEPFFAFVHVWDIHYDYTPPPPYDTLFDPGYTGPITGANFEKNPAIHPKMDKRDLEHVIALYDGEIACTDEYLGKLFDEIDARGLRERTLIVVTADHGEEFFEHGSKGHQKSLFEEVLRIPLIVSWPGRVPAGLRVKEQSRIIDIAPTIAELCGLPVNREGVGKSLVPSFDGRGRDLPAYAELELATAGASLRSVRTPDYKIVWNNRRNRGNLFEIATDPGEREPRTGDSKYAEIAIKYLREWNAFVDQLAQSLPRSKGEAAAAPPEAVIEHLRTLGYIGDRPPGAPPISTTPPEPPHVGGLSGSDPAERDGEGDEPK